MTQPIILIRGGGDLGSGVAMRLRHAGLPVVIAEIDAPLVVRRAVAFAEAIYEGQTQVEDLVARRVSADEIPASIRRGEIPVLVDPKVQLRQDPRFNLLALIDARLTKKPPDLGTDAAPLVIGLGPGFIGGVNCHAAIETNRGHTLGRIYRNGPTLPDTGIPERVLDVRAERVLRAPADGPLQAHGRIGDRFARGQIIAEVAGHPIRAPFAGVLRGLVRPGRYVTRGLKVGDLDPRNDPRHCFLVSDKALALGGAVLEVLLGQAEIRQLLCTS